MELRRFSRLDLVLFLISLAAIVLSIVVILVAGPIRNLFNSSSCDDITEVGTVLSEGQEWCGGDLSLTADEYCVEKCGPDISVTFLLENYSEQDIVVEVLEQDFRILVANDTEVKPGMLSVLPVENNVSIGRLLLQPGDKKEWTWLFTYHTPEVRGRSELSKDIIRYQIDVLKIGPYIQQARWRDEIR